MLHKGDNSMKRLVPLILPLLLAATPLAAEPGSIGYVDMQVLLDKSKMGQKAQEALKEKFAGKQEEFAKEEQSIRQLQQTLARDEALMSQTELDKKKGELKARVEAFQKQVAEAQQALVQEQNKLGVEILEPAQGIIEEVAKDKKVTAVFERRQSGLLYIDEGVDLTPEVIKRLDAKTKN
jgi:outer membrane protein